MKLRIIDKFADWVLEQKLFELAQQRSITINNIKSYADTLNRHLFKLYIYQDSFYREHWKDEIYNYTFTILNCKWGKDKKWFETDDYYEWLFYDYFNLNSNRINIKRIFKNTLEKYKFETELKGWNETEYYNLCERFYNLICPFLEKGYISDETFDEIIKTFDLK